MRLRRDWILRRNKTITSIKFQRRRKGMVSKALLRNWLPSGRETAPRCNRQEEEQTGPNEMISVGLVEGFLSDFYLRASILWDTGNKEKLEKVWNCQRFGLTRYTLRTAWHCRAQSRLTVMNL